MKLSKHYSSSFDDFVSFWGLDYVYRLIRLLHKRERDRNFCICVFDHFRPLILSVEFFCGYKLGQSVGVFGGSLWAGHIISCLDLNCIVFVNNSGLMTLCFIERKMGLLPRDSVR